MHFQNTVLHFPPVRLEMRLAAENIRDNTNTNPSANGPFGMIFPRKQSKGSILPLLSTLYHSYKKLKFIPLLSLLSHTSKIVPSLLSIVNSALLMMFSNHC